MRSSSRPMVPTKRRAPRTTSPCRRAPGRATKRREAAREAMSMAKGKTRRSERGLTLVELLIVVALIAVLTGTVMMGPGMLEGSRLKSAATLIVSGVRLGLTRASTTGKPTRLSFDLDNGNVTLEEASSSVVLREHTKDASSGAEPATELEKKAHAESDRILDGPHSPRPSFRPVAGFNAGSGDTGLARS